MDKQQFTIENILKGIITALLLFGVLCLMECLGGSSADIAEAEARSVHTMYRQSLTENP